MAMHSLTMNEQQIILNALGTKVKQEKIRRGDVNSIQVPPPPPPPKRIPLEPPDTGKNADKNEAVIEVPDQTRSFLGQQHAPDLAVSFIMLVFLT